MHLYDAQSSRKLDQQIIERGVNPEQLIMRAAASIWNLSKNFTAPGNIWCLAGSGNNGGDAIGVSGLAKIENKTVTLITLQEPKGVSQNILRFIKLLNVKCIKSLPKLEEVSKDDLVIDGLIGTGLSRPLEPWLEDGIDWINKAKMIGAKVISIDVPSGMNSSEGVVKHKAVRADATAMCLSAKQGCYTGSAANYTGALHMMDLGIKKPQKYLSGTSYLLTKEVATPRTRSNISHKGNFGTVLILGGWDGMEGAGHLAAKAALKVGAGKVYLCGGNIKNQPPEAIYVRRNLDEFNSILEKSDCIVAGPGLGQNANDYLYAAWLSKKPLVLDADGLNWLSKTKPTQRKNFIGTPHPGEAKTLLHSSSTKRFKLLKRLQLNM